MTAIGIYKHRVQAEACAARWAEVFGDDAIVIDFTGTAYIVLIPTE